MTGMVEDEADGGGVQAGVDGVQHIVDCASGAEVNLRRLPAAIGDADEARSDAGASTTFTATIGNPDLTPGTYTAQVTVSDPYSTNGSDTVFFTLVVNAVADTTAPVVTVPAS